MFSVECNKIIKLGAQTLLKQQHAMPVVNGIDDNNCQLPGHP